MKLSPADMVIEGFFAKGDQPQDFMFAPVEGRYICLQSLSSQRKDPFASVAELWLLGDRKEPLARERWSVVTVDCEELLAEDGHAENALDDDPQSIWHTSWGSSRPDHPHEIVIDFTIVAFCIFMVIRGMNALRRKQESPAAIAASTTKACPECQMTIPINAKRCGYCTTVLQK